MDRRLPQRSKRPLLYSVLDDWYVCNIDSIGSLRAHYIGLVDVFGFEDCATNGLEQLCINTTNELLQQHFVHFLIKVKS
jgi:myosin heavy subunit